MTQDLEPLARAFICLGVILSGIGVVLLLGPKVPWLGRLPGDIAIQRDGFSFYFPLTSCLLASVLLSALLWLVGQFRS